MYDDYKPSLDELMHYGVKGMKWGKRIGNTVVKYTAGAQNLKSKIARSRAKGFKIDRDSLVSERKAMLNLTSKSGKRLFTDKDLDDMINGLEKNIDKYTKKANNYETIAKMLMQDIDASRK